MDGAKAVSTELGPRRESLSPKEECDEFDEV